jgi:hypothetical protein
MTQKSSQLMFKNQGMPSLIGCQQVWKSSSIKLDAGNFSTAGNHMLQRCWHTPVIAPLLVMFPQTLAFLLQLSTYLLQWLGTPCQLTV